MSGRGRRHWWLVVAWMAVILTLTTIPLPSMPAAQAADADKLGHALMYWPLGALLARALRRELPARGSLFIILMSVLLLALFGALDEWHQQFVNRQTSVPDWLADLIGGTLGAGAGALAWRYRAQEETDG